jgi:hypothetical protein
MGSELVSTCYCPISLSVVSLLYFAHNSVPAATAAHSYWWRGGREQHKSRNLNQYHVILVEESILLQFFHDIFLINIMGLLLQSIKPND